MPIYEFETVHEPVPRPHGHKRRVVLKLLISFFGLAFLLAVPAHFVVMAIDAFFRTDWLPYYEPVRSVALIPFQLIGQGIDGLLR